MNNSIYHFRRPPNLVELEYLPGSDERQSLKEELSRQYGMHIEVPCIIGGKSVYTGRTTDIIMPDEKMHVLGKAHLAGQNELDLAIETALAAHSMWENMPQEHRAAIFLRAAELLVKRSNHDRIGAAVMLNQSKTVTQMEGDSGTGLSDLLRYNVYFASQIFSDQPDSTNTSINRIDWRPLEGFVAAVSPFNYASDAANLAIAPAIVGNTVVWKPSTKSVLSNYLIMEVLREAGLPDGVINFVPSRGDDFLEHVITDKHLAGIHFIGSTDTFRKLWKVVGNNISLYRNFPRLVGETGGKNYVLAHNDCDTNALVTALIKGAFELQGQKCSSTSRAYIPNSIWHEVKKKLLAEVEKIEIGGVMDFRNYISAVIDQEAFDAIKMYIEDARSSPDAEVICGGCDDHTGFFVEPTVILCNVVDYPSMTEEIFGPVLSIYVYEDDDLPNILRVIDESTQYALTGSIFCKDRRILSELERSLRYTAGNIYLNDKSTGSMAGYIPFGGARASGTNDKPGSKINMLKWVSPRTIKDTLVAPDEWCYKSMCEE